MMSLLSNCTSGGCGAKIGPGELSKVLAGMPVFSDHNLLVGFDASDDAAVYQIAENTAIVSTVDFFSPMVDDARSFGRIAAANALSDVYSMGGTPLFALNLVCYPERMEIDALGEILLGGAEKIQEAGALLCGGHSIYDKEPKYGLAVTGRLDPKQIWRNNTPVPGDQLILTKPLGIGIVMAALRGEVADEEAVQAAISSMQRLNKYAAEKMHSFPISACTDITGFGLLAHAREMAGEAASLVIYSSELPYIPQARTYAGDFLITAAAQRNRNHMGGFVDLGETPFALQELMFDPQTSGGLFLSVPKACAQELLSAIQEVESQAKIVGEVLPPQNSSILVR
ncbi:selenium donor protein [Desulfosporosinus orientis DSM 765]|uniref:Selenide, water dikinase n=1 Tax=Desulfosporosinus orientis (strain ATCC 19365 / DSM 765 / NCIMB 8382 / VKM B-1628 / Singapore I) TaxID=768706 RepID=G7WHV6_DESOD|nr:selenide, water dikinase SelD [Desulfosporosinus orientis]AET69668.1 selenium donor protein [Desulfosporosinus orientis DSM 765]